MKQSTKKYFSRSSNKLYSLVFYFFDSLIDLPKSHRVTSAFVDWYSQQQKSVDINRFSKHHLIQKDPAIILSRKKDTSSKLKQTLIAKSCKSLKNTGI